MLDNTNYGICDIVIEANAKCYCPLGQDWYTNHFTISMTPAKSIPDYCVVDKFVNEHINGKHFIIEEAVQRLHTFIVESYKPQECCVKSYVDDAAHSTVTVTKYV